MNNIAYLLRTGSKYIFFLTLSVILSVDICNAESEIIITNYGLTEKGIFAEWETNFPATSQIEYGLDSNLGLFSDMDNNLVLKHFVGSELPISIGMVYYFRVLSKDAAGNLFSSDIRRYVFDVTEPIISIISPQDRDEVSGNIAIEFSIQEDNGISNLEVYIDFEKVASLDTTERIYNLDTTKLTDGEHKIDISAIDMGNNISESSVKVIVKNLPPDTTSPTVTIIYPHEDQLLYGKVKIIAEATDDQEIDEVIFLIDRRESGYDDDAPYERITNTGAYEPGPHTYQARVIDKAGNVGLSQVVHVNISSVPVDNEPPVITIAYPEDGAFVNKDITLVYMVTDNISLPENITIIGDESPYTTEGEHRVVLTAIDEAQNEGIAKVNFTIDKTPPYTTHDYTYAGVWVNTDVHITLTATDGLSGVDKTYFTIDGGAENVGTSINITTEGEHVVKFWSVDKVGNIEPVHEISVKIDKTPPETIATPSLAPNEAGWINVLPVTVNFTATDNLSGVAITTPSVSIAEEGIREIKYSSTDNAGNVEVEKIITVKVDTTSPVTVDNYAYNGVWVNQDQEITLTPSDNLSGVKETYYTVDELQGMGTTIGITTEGAHTVEYWSMDNAGNTEAKHTLSVKIDKTPPVVETGPDIKVSMATTQGTVVIITPTVTDNLDPSPKVTTDAPAIFPLGITTVTITATDHAGNIGKDTVKVIVYLKLSAGSLKFVPHVINVNRTHGNFMAFIKKVGMGLTVYDIDGKSVVIRNPFNNIEVKAKWSIVIPRHKWRHCPREPWMIVIFSRKELIDSLQGHTGNITLTIAGNISRGTFEGQDVVKVIKPRWYHHWWYRNLNEDRLIEMEEQEGLSIEDLTIQYRINKEFER